MPYLIRPPKFHRITDTIRQLHLSTQIEVFPDSPLWYILI